MEKLHMIFLHILRAALHGEHAAQSLTADEWQQLLTLAQAHKVLPLIYEALPYPPARQQVMQQIMQQAIKTEDFLSLYRHLSASGIRPLVVKGIVCRSIYPKPDLRPSSDEDMLIPTKIFERCHGEMLRYGMQTAEDLSQYEVSYRKQNSPLFIELHKSLFSPQSDAYGDLNRFYEEAFDWATEVSIEGVNILTLCPTDHLFYLICHTFKHFLHSGFGIRQVCDIVMFANCYCEEIDWPLILSNCASIHAEIFTAALFRIGDEYLGFGSPEIFKQIETDESALLEDLLDSGVYGSSAMSRLHSSNITLNAVSGKKRSGLIASLFPAPKQLESRYPYLKKSPWLLPIAWCSRILHYRSENSGAAEALSIGNHRVELLKQYGIIKKT